MYNFKAMACQRGCYILGAALALGVFATDIVAFTPRTSFALISERHLSIHGTDSLPWRNGLSHPERRQRPVCLGGFDLASVAGRAEGRKKTRQPLRAVPAAEASTDEPDSQSDETSATGQPDEAAASSGGLAAKLKGYPGAVYKFTRPHTIRGTILASVTGVARCLVEAPSSISMKLVPRALLGMLALLLGNAYIVGINQIYDVDIDKINKPELPIASGEMSKRLAWGIVLASVTAGPYIVFRAFSPLIFRLYAFGLTIGGLYSVPPFQFKRFAVMAGLIIACVRGFLLNFGVYYAVREALGMPFRWNPAVLFLARFMTVFACVIAVTKDLPDVKGDRKYNISTFASKRGVKFTARAACAVLGLNYISAMVEGILSPAGAFNRKVMVGGHAVLLAMLGRSLRKLEPDSQDSVKSFYKRIWDLFYLEYAMYPFI